MAVCNDNKRKLPTVDISACFACAQAGLQWFTQLRFLTAGYFAMEALVQNELHGSSLDRSQGFDKQLMAFIKSGLVSANTVQRSVIDQMSKPQPG